MMSVAAAASPSELGVHFTVPEGTTFISDIHPEDEVGEGEGGEDGYSSWKAWGVGKKTVMSVTIPSSVTTIGRNAFWGCKLLVNVTIPPSVTSIEGSAFEGCSSLTSVDIRARRRIGRRCTKSNARRCSKCLCRHKQGGGNAHRVAVVVRGKMLAWKVVVGQQQRVAEAVVKGAKKTRTCAQSAWTTKTMRMGKDHSLRYAVRVGRCTAALAM